MMRRNKPCLARGKTTASAVLGAGRTGRVRDTAGSQCGRGTKGERGRHRWVL